MRTIPIFFFLNRQIINIEKIQEQNKWFMNWEQDIDLERILKKKEWTSSY